MNRGYRYAEDSLVAFNLGSDRFLTHSPPDRTIRVTESDILTDPDQLTRSNLNDAERYVRTFELWRTTMGPSPGVDGIKLSEYTKGEMGKALRLTAKAINDNTFHPRDHREVKIPKPAGRFRTLSIPIVAERIVARTLNLALLDILDAQMPDAFHGYRRGRSIHTLLADLARAYIPDQPFFVGTADVRNAFPSVTRLAVEQALNRFVPDRGLRDLLLLLTFAQSDLGLPQGLATSTTLYNLLASHHLSWPTPKQEGRPHQLLYVDNHVYAGGSAESIEQAFGDHQRELARLGMEFTPPLDPVDLSEGKAELFGFELRTSKGQAAYTPTSENWSKLERAIRFAYLDSDPSAQAESHIKAWIAYNAITIETVGVERLLRRISSYCRQNQIHLNLDHIRVAATRASDRWNQLIAGRIPTVVTGDDLLVDRPRDTQETW